MTVLDYRHAPAPEVDSAQTSGHWFGWAVYLAMSWTWCIGMFLPVLLVRDYGLWGWVVFAVPNVIGAAAMGWVLHTRESSRAIVQAHRPAMIAFSSVTCAFQFFFAAWMFARLPLAMLMLATGAVAAGISLISGRRKSVIEQSVAGGVLLVSAVCCIVSAPHLSVPLWGFEWQWERFEGLVPMSLASIFGFVLCPYLDLTFHHARQQCNAADAQRAFGIGFGVIFLAAICFSLAYASPLRYFLTPVPALLMWAVSVHFAVQLGFTTGVHWLELRLQARLKMGVWLALVLATAVAGFLALRVGDSVWDEHVMSSLRRIPAEIVYRLFMGFYGLMFPAYVWVCMIPSARATPTRWSLIVFAAAVLVAGPMFWMGFIQGQMVWLLPGLAVVLLSRLAVPRNPLS